MVKYRHAYYEACNIMIDQSAHKVHLADFFQMDQVFRAPTDYEFEHEISTSAVIKQQRPSMKDEDGDCDDLVDDADEGLMGDMGEDGEDEDLADLSAECSKQ